MLSPRVSRTLAPLSAASGLAAAGPWLYAIADDRDLLAAFPRRGGERATLVPGVGGDPGPQEKPRKPDLEALVALPGGGLLALGSGATIARHRGVFWPSPHQAVAARAVDLTALHAAIAARLSSIATDGAVGGGARLAGSAEEGGARLAGSVAAAGARLADPAAAGGRQCAELNLEGACVHGEHPLLAQRGNGAAGVNALVTCSLAPILDALRTRSPPPASALLEVHRVAGLGTAEDGTPLALTDPAALPDGRLLATAVAEQVASTYADGACVAAAAALLRADGTVLRVERLAVPWKVEGIVAEARGDGTVDLLLCADPDEPGAVAPLLGATLRL